MAAKSKGGRPSTYTQEIAARICEEIASGKSLKKVCALNGMPAMSTVFLWIARHKEFSENYARAQADRVVAWSEEIVDIADNSKADTNRAKLRVDTRRWLMSKMDPKKYGDRQEHRHSGHVGTYDLSKLSDDELDRLESILGPLAVTGGGAGGEGEAAG
mgnify:CR=1 FL=1